MQIRFRLFQDHLKPSISYINEKGTMSNNNEDNSHNKNNDNDNNKDKDNKGKACD